MIRSNFLLSAIRYLFRSTRDGRRDRDARNDVFTNWPFNGQKLTAPLKEFIAHSRRKKGNNTAFLLHYSFEQMGKNVLKSISHFFDFFFSLSLLCCWQIVQNYFNYSNHTHKTFLFQPFEIITITWNDDVDLLRSGIYISIMNSPLLWHALA